MIARPRIRPLGLSELLDESFRLYRHYFVVFVAISALVLVPYALISLVIQIPLQRQIEAIQTQATSGLDPLGAQSLWDFFGSLAFTVLGSVGVSLIYTILLQPLMEGALARTVSQGYLERPVSLGDSFGTALRNVVGLVGARLLPALFSAVGLGLLLGLSFGMIALTAGANPFEEEGAASRLVTGLGLIFCMFGLFVVAGILGLLVFVRLIFTSQAVVLEGRGAIDGISRSWALTRDYFWRTLGYVLVIALVVFFIAGVPALVITLPLQFLIPDQLMLQTVINTVVSTILNVIVTPFGLIAYTLMYYDLRIRKEGFDLEQQTMQQLVGSYPPQFELR